MNLKECMSDEVKEELINSITGDIKNADTRIAETIENPKISKENKSQIVWQWIGRRKEANNYYHLITGNSFYNEWELYEEAELLD